MQRHRHGAELGQRRAHRQPRLQLDRVALTVVKGQGFDPLVTGQGMGQAGGGVLTAGEKDEGCGVHGLEW